MKKVIVLLLFSTITLAMPLQAFAAEVTFSDVPENHLFYKDVEQMVDKGITKGCSGDEYCPDEHVTRAQMASFLVRALELPGEVSDYFGDDAKSVHEADINTLAASGITSGCTQEGDDFCPRDKVTRGQMAAFLVRAIGLKSADVDYFWDDEDSPFQANINSLAHYGLTTGSAPGFFSPEDLVTRSEMAAFLTRAMSLGDNPKPDPKIGPKPELPPGGTPELNRQLGKLMAAQRGWTGDQWYCLDKFIQRESGWIHTAKNPTSTAYGIFQFLNSTWGLVGARKTSDPAGQIEAGLDYVQSRYKTPCGAWSFWQKNHWY